MSVQPAESDGIDSDRQSALLTPYPGLRPFAETEQRLFFGRTQQVKDILQRLENTSFAVVTGGSGSGKSSIVNAGVIPALRKKQLSSRGDFWLVATFSPKDQPFRNLASELATLIAPLPGQTATQLAGDVEQTLLETNSLAGFFERYESRIILEEGQAPESRKSANLLIFCDQFEEIFREQNRDNPQAEQLVNLIVEAYRNQSDYPRLFLIIGMRSEDLHRCAAFIDLPNVINGSVFLTRRLDETEIASAIVEPMRLSLRLRGVRPQQYNPIEVDPWPFETDILRRLNLATATIASDPDHLPLLQHLLSVLWRYLDKNQLIPAKGAAAVECQKFRVTSEHLAKALNFSSVKAMDEFVRLSDERELQNKRNEAWILQRALDGSAEAVMPSGPRFGSIAGRMFRLLAEVDDRGNYKRRWTSRQEILDVAADRKATLEEVNSIIGAFSDPYPFLNAKEGLDGKIDVSHESFIRNWTQFRDWLENERSLATAYNILRTKYLEYLRIARDPKVNPFRRLWSRFFARLNNEQLVQLADWKRTRSQNVAWATRYANGVEGEDPESGRRSASDVQGERTNESLLGFYQRSKRLSYGPASVSLLVIAALIALLGLWLDQVQQGITANRELTSALVTMVASSAAENSNNRAGVDAREVNEKLYELTGSDAIALSARQSRTDAIGILLMGYRAFTGRTDDPGVFYYVARNLSDGSARKILDNAVLPNGDTGKNDAPASAASKDASLRPACAASLNNSDVLKNVLLNGDGLDAGSAHVALAPLERAGGKQIAMVPTNNGNLVLLVLSNDDTCTLQYLQSFSLPPGKLQIDKSLKLLAVNLEGTKPEERQSWIYRIWWTRRCTQDGAPKIVQSGNAGKCDVPFSAEITGPMFFPQETYRILDETHLETVSGKIKKRFDLPIDHRPVLLSAAEAGKISFQQPVVDSREALCARSGHYGALIKKGPTENSTDPSATTLYIVEQTADIAKCGDIRTDKAIATIPLTNYSIGHMAFSEPRDDGAEPEFIYLQGAEPKDAAVYRLALIPERMYCLSIDDLFVDKLPSSNAPRTPLYAGLLMQQKIPDDADYVPGLINQFVKVRSCGGKWGTAK